MNVFGMFLKQPVPGKVKTRLASSVGDDMAARLYEAFVADLADRFRNVGDRRVLCFAPNDEQGRNFANSLAGVDYQVWPQPDDSLDERMRAFFSQAQDVGGQRVVLIGSDSPSLPHDNIEEAFMRLETHDCVLGPATDGGYYLIGMRGVLQRVFDGVDWSTARVLAQTVEQISREGARLSLLPPWYDVDTAEDLDLLRGHVAAMQLTGESVGLDRTELLFGEL